MSELSKLAKVGDLPPPELASIRKLKRKQALSVLELRVVPEVPHMRGKREPMELPLWKKIGSKLEFEQIGEGAIVTTHLPLFRIHCPNVRGCRASYLNRESEGEQVNYELKFFGIGLGSGKKITFTGIEDYEVLGQCIEVMAEAELEAKFGNLWSSNTRLMSGVRLDIRKIDKNRIKASRLPANRDPCGLSPRQIRRLENRGFVSGSFDLTDFARSKISVHKVDQIAHERSDSTEVTLPLTIAGAPFSITMSCERTLSSEVSVKCDMVGGKRYHWYCSGGKSKIKSMECFWTVSN
jgi:hypothetical protein